MIEKLPPPETEVNVPGMFAVTSVANAGGCLLKLVTSGFEWKHKRLPTAPEAVVGSLLHRLSERWLKGDGPDRPDALFEEELARINSELASDSSSRFVVLEKTRTPLDWMILRREAIARCRTLPRGMRHGSEREPTRGRRAFGAEVWLEAPALGLKGKADEIVDHGTHVLIRDYKTGSIHEASGAVKLSITLQLRLYGLIAATLYPGRRIVLEVDGLDSKAAVAWNDETRHRTEEEWLQIRRRLEASTMACATIAAPGACCRYCPIRHRCGAYLNAAPSWWRVPHPRDECLPLDIWGTVAAVSTERGRTCVTLIDTAGRAARVTDLDVTSGTWNPGNLAYFFGLERSGRSSGWGTSTSHPQHFHELAPDRSARRAWAMQPFAGH